MRIGKKVVAIGTLAIGISLAGAAAANAGTTLLGYNMIAPYWGGGVNTQLQTKSYTNVAGYVQTGYIGGGGLYNANAKQCKYTFGTGISGCGTLVSNVYSYGYVNLPQTATAGTSCVATFSIQGLNWVRVNIQGYWASN
ncbi:MAG: hypothetical protein HIU88_12470 [Acidobacteria bacterium]|nr:hypothetical protein [Acidobacteriota bacterium]